MSVGDGAGDWGVMAMMPTDMFLGFWRALNAALVVRGEPEALHGEARRWWDWRPVKFVDDRLVNRVVNERRPI